MKVLGIILGVILFIGGIQLAATPIETAFAASSVIPIFIGAALTVSGVFRFVSWIRVKKAGYKDGLLFWESILSFVFGLFILISWSLHLTIAFAVLIPVFASAVIIGSGIVRIIRSIQMKKLNDSINTIIGSVKLSWGWELALGILFVVFGIFCACNPFATFLAVGIMFGINIAMCGLTLIMSSCTM